MTEQFDGWRPRCKPVANLVRPVRVDPTGLAGPTRAESRGSRWRQSSYGRYVPTRVSDEVPEQRILEQSARLPATGAVTGWAACRMWGAAFFDGLARDGRTRTPVPLVIGPDKAIRGDRRIQVLRDRIDEHEVVDLNGVPCTRRPRALFDAMRLASDAREATVSMDMMAAAELVSISQMWAYVETHPGWRGVPQVRRALELSCEESMSPNETRLRLIWVLDAGLPRPLMNQPVFDAGGHLIGVADLLDPVAGVVGEFDGAAHRTGRRHQRDVRREDRFRRAGLEYFKVVGRDLLDVDLVVQRMLTTRHRALRLPQTERRWSVVAPPGWYQSPVETMTLDERLAHSEALHGLAIT